MTSWRRSATGRQRSSVKRLVCVTGKPCTLHAESTNPSFTREGDDVIVTPSAPVHDGCLVVARLHDGSVLFRRYNVTKPNGKSFRLSCSNKDYAMPLDLTWKEVAWVYRVSGSMRHFDERSRR